MRLEVRHAHSMAGMVEDAIRRAVTPGDELATPSGRGHFSLAPFTADDLILLLGE
jgi:hypothetical protein